MNSGRNALKRNSSLTNSIVSSDWNRETLPTSWLRRSPMSSGATGTASDIVGLILITQISCGRFSLPTKIGRISSLMGGLSEKSPSQ